MSVFTTPALPPTLSDMLRARDRALELHQQARHATRLAKETLEAAGQYLVPGELNFREPEERVVKALDQRMWTRAFDITGFRQLMDAQAVDQFERSLHADTPEFTEANIQATFLELNQKSDEMFRRGIVRVFRGLDREYRSHDAFRVKRKAILTFMLRPGFRGGMQVGYGTPSHQLDDIDRVFKTLDKKRFQPRALESGLNAAFKERQVFEDDYYRAKGFRNGNLHLEFKRDDLLERVNELIAEHYGATLGRDAA